MSLALLFDPKSVALVGASADSKKISGMLVTFLQKSGFNGRVYPVNPRYDQIGDWTCYPSVDAIPETVDVAVIALPVAAVRETLEAVARRGTPFAVLMSGGFGEGRSGEEGTRRLAWLNSLIDETGIRVVGPNTVGLVNFLCNFPLTFADWYGRDNGRRGNVAILSHSGSVGGLLFSALQLASVGIAYWIATGNEADLEIADFIAHLSDDPNVHIIACFMEGVMTGRHFMVAAENARAKGKRIVVLKSGATEESIRATSAHTRKHSTSADVYDAVFRQLGIVQVTSMSELIYAVKLLLALEAVPGGRIGILSASGGACSLLADHAVSCGLVLPELPIDVQRQIELAVPEYGSARNPVDLSADVVSRREILTATLAALTEDNSVDIWVVFGRPIIDRYYSDLAEFARSSGKAVVVASGVPLDSDVADYLTQHGVPVLLDPALCLQAIGRVRVGSEPSPADWNTEKPRPTGGEWKDCSNNLLAGGEAALLGNDASSGTLDCIEAGILQDQDFGPILSIELKRVRTSRPRTVRVLPLQAAELRDAIAEFVRDNGQDENSQELIGERIAALYSLYRSKEEIAELSVTFVTDCHGAFQVTTRKRLRRDEMLTMPADLIGV